MYRERLTITMEAELVAAADTLVDKSTIRNRSHAIEHLVREGLGLHLLGQAFLFVEEAGWSQELAEKAVRLCQAQGIRQLFLCLPSAATGLRADMEQIIAGIGGFDIVSVPADFGSGGALVLQKAALRNPFLLLWIGSGLVLPESLTAAYVAHRTGRRPLTQLVSSTDGTTYTSSRVAIAEPDLISLIPAGIVSLEADVFAQLLKDGKVTPYASHTP